MLASFVTSGLDGARNIIRQRICAFVTFKSSTGFSQLKNCIFNWSKVIANERKRLGVSAVAVM